MTDFNIKINYKEIADKIGVTKESIAKKLEGAVEALSISTHAFVVKYANDHLTGFTRSHFIGEDGSNIRWAKISNNMWMVEIDESVKWIEEGRSATSMATEDWLLKPGKSKTAKDGSKYRVIPFSHNKDDIGTPPAMRQAITESLKFNKVNMKKIEFNPDGMPKIGIVQKLKDLPKLDNPDNNMYQFRSQGRTSQEAEEFGLPKYEGSHFLSGGVVVQRPTKRGKIRKEVITFRVVSSKHEAEGRWMYPAVTPLNSIPAAHEYANKEWEKIIKSLEEYFGGV